MGLPGGSWCDGLDVETTSNLPWRTTPVKCGAGLSAPGGDAYIAPMSATTGSLEEFDAFRARMNDIILNAGNLTINRFFALDNRAYEAGALGAKNKEMLGLVASLVLRCDDCITYHVVRCHEESTTRAEFLEIFSVGLVVSGSIVIPHLRRAMARLEELEARARG